MSYFHTVPPEPSVQFMTFQSSGGLTSFHEIVTENYGIPIVPEEEFIFQIWIPLESTFCPTLLPSSPQNNDKIMPWTAAMVLRISFLSVYSTRTAIDLIGQLSFVQLSVFIICQHLTVRHPTNLTSVTC